MTLQTIADPTTEAVSAPSIPSMPSVGAGAAGATTPQTSAPQPLAGQGAEVPAYLQGQVDDTAANMAAAAKTGGMGYRFLRFKGGEYVVSGKVGEQNMGSVMDVVILGNTKDPHPRRLFVQNSNKPACSSDDGKKPNPGVPHPQSATCMSCPMARFNTASKVGGKGRGMACQERMWVAAVVPQQPDLVLRWDLAFTAREAIEAFCEGMAEEGYPLTAAVVRLGSRVNPDAGTKGPPTIPTFTFHRYLTKEEWDMHQEARRENADIIESIVNPGGGEQVDGAAGQPHQVTDQSGAVEKHAAAQEAYDTAHNPEIAF